MPAIPSNFQPDFEPILRQQRSEPLSVLPVRSYRRCFFTHSGVGLRRFRVIDESRFPRSGARFDKPLTHYALYKFLTERRVRLRGPNLLLLHNHWSSNYFHWLTEVLPKLQFVDPAVYRVALPADYPAFARHSLAIFKPREVLLVPARRAISAMDVTVVGNPVSGQYVTNHLRWLTTTLKGSFGPAAEDMERVYITRGNARMRRVLNEDDVVGALTDYGFRVVDPMHLSFQEQVQGFGGCSVLVSLHGAALANSLFMPTGSRLLELYPALPPDTGGMNTCYWDLCRAIGVDYYYQFCEDGPSRDAEIGRRDVIVDTDKLRENIELMLERPPPR
jgi:capsular polysaccharide biosynthesis protein